MAHKTRKRMAINGGCPTRNQTSRMHGNERKYQPDKRCVKPLNFAGPGGCCNYN